jgi:hypothetical protein
MHLTNLLLCFLSVSKKVRFPITMAAATTDGGDKYIRPDGKQFIFI